MYRHLVHNRASGDIVTVNRALFAKNDGYWAMMCFVTQVIAFFQINDSIIGVAKLAGTLDNGIEHRPDVGRRGSDDAQDIGAAGLVGEGFREIAGALLDLVEQTHILDRDHGLVGEGGDEIDLLLRERLDPLAGQYDHPDRFVLA
jgi:hypothetical protein